MTNTASKKNVWFLGTTYANATITKEEPGWIHFTAAAGKEWVLPTWGVLVS